VENNPSGGMGWGAPVSPEKKNQGRGEQGGSKGNWIARGGDKHLLMVNSTGELRQEDGV